MLSWIAAMPNEFQSDAVSVTPSKKGARIVTEEGTLKDLSKTGCKIFGPTTSSKGSCLTLILHLEDGQATFRLNDVTVSSVGKDSFAVRFPKLAAEDRKRLLELVRKMPAWHPWTIGGRHSASRRYRSPVTEGLIGVSASDSCTTAAELPVNPLVARANVH